MKPTCVLAPVLVLALGLWVAPVRADGDDAAAAAATNTKQKTHEKKAGKGGNKKTAHEATDAGKTTTKEKNSGKAAKSGKHARNSGATSTPADTAPVLGDAQSRVDKRQQLQAARIDAGVKRGSLTPDELTKLQAQQKSIADMEAKFAGDGALTKDEATQLRQSLNDASLQIWTEKRDTDGVQQPVVRLGKDVYLNDATAAKLGDPALTRQDARAFSHDFARLLDVKGKLASEDLTDDQRAALQKEYNDLLSKYFVAKTSTDAAAG